MVEEKGFKTRINREEKRASRKTEVERETGSVEKYLGISTRRLFHRTGQEPADGKITYAGYFQTRIISDCTTK